MLAFAHKLEQAIHDGVLRDRVHAAEVLGLTRARVTQILNLLLLAPDIQAEILGLQTTAGREPVVEGNLRPLTATAAWSRQRAAWTRIRSGLRPL